MRTRENVAGVALAVPKQRRPRADRLRRADVTRRTAWAMFVAESSSRCSVGCLQPRPPASKSAGTVGFRPTETACQRVRWCRACCPNVLSQFSCSRASVKREIPWQFGQVGLRSAAPPQPKIPPHHEPRICRTVLETVMARSRALQRGRGTVPPCPEVRAEALYYEPHVQVAS